MNKFYRGSVRKQNCPGCVLMSRYATRIDDLSWGTQFVASPSAQDMLPVKYQPQLLYPSSAPSALHAPAMPTPASPTVPLATSSSSSHGSTTQTQQRSDMIAMVLFVLVVGLCLCVVHLNAKLNSLQTLVNLMLVRHGAPIK